MFSIVAVPGGIATKSVGGFPFATPSPALICRFFKNYLFIYLFIFGCVGSSFLCEGFL